MTALLTLALCYGGFTALCFATHRHQRLLWRHGLGARGTVLLRVLGSALLAASAAVSLAGAPGTTGLVAWFGFLTTAGLALVFLLPYLPRCAIGLAVALPAVATLGALTSG